MMSSATSRSAPTCLAVLAMLEPDELCRWWALHKLMLRTRALVREPRVREAVSLIVNVLLNEDPDLRGKRLDALVARVDEMLKTKETP